MINYPALLLRKKTQLYPEGRTSYRFKRMLRNKVEIVGKSAFSNPKINELDQPETDLQGDDVGGATGYGALTEEKK